MNSYLCKSAEETIDLGKKLAGSFEKGTIISLEGGLGAGKTTLAKGIITGLGVTETITSPTYTIISEYMGKFPVYHMDLYRVEEEEELYNLGLDDYFYGGGISLVEWMERLPELPDQFTRIVIEVTEDHSSRKISLEKVDQKAKSTN